MATNKKKKKRRTNRADDITTSIVTLFVGAMLVIMAFVEGTSVWKAAHDVLFGLFGCGSYVVGVAVCYFAVLLARGEELASHASKLLLGLLFASGTVIVFSDIQPQGLSIFEMIAACYANGRDAWLGGGVLGAVFGGTLLALCGRPVANILVVLLTLCAGLFIFNVTPADVWQWGQAVFGTVQEHGKIGRAHV